MEHVWRVEDWNDWTGVVIGYRNFGRSYNEGTGVVIGYRGIFIMA
jgi:hypothetical protein